MLLTRLFGISDIAKIAAITIGYKLRQAQQLVILMLLNFLAQRLGSGRVGSDRGLYGSTDLCQCGHLSKSDFQRMYPSQQDRTTSKWRMDADFPQTHGFSHRILELLSPQWHHLFRFLEFIWIEVIMKPWLGAQEVLYESLLWHLKVPRNYASQVAANKLVFPGESMVNIANPPNTHTAVSLEGKVDAWVTDIECATSCRPKLYGFDFGRVTEVYVDHVIQLPDGGEKAIKKAIIEKSPRDRKDDHGISGEKAMMKDLILSAMDEGGEICITYHMLNAFLPATSNVEGRNIGSFLGHTAATNLGNTDFTAGNGLPKQIIENNASQLGLFLKEVLQHPLSDGKDIYVRLLHEPNIGYFWWGEPNSNQLGDYFQNFHKLWNSLVTTIEAAMTAAERARIKYVFSINGKKRTNITDEPLLIINASQRSFERDLKSYFPTQGSSDPTQDEQQFLSSISVLGLDYYEDWARNPETSQLIAQYDMLVNKVADINARHILTWDHALTEVSIRSDSKGKLYGGFGSQSAWDSKKFTFFNDVVFKLAKQNSPKWIMFWVNRLGNSALTSYTPTTAAKSNGIPPLYYGRTDVYKETDAELYYPMFPASPFYVDTFKAGDASGNTFFKFISPLNPETINKIPVAYDSGKLTDGAQRYFYAMQDFSNLTPLNKIRINKSNILAVESYLKDKSQVRPSLNPADVPTAEESASQIFDVL